MLNVRTETPRGTSRAAARESLLRAAEDLIARFGFDAPSVREITAAAGTRLATVSEEFGGIDGLTRAVVEGKASILADARIAALRAAQDAAPPVRLADVVHAYIAPLFALMKSDADWRNHARVSAQLVVSARWDARIGSTLETEAGDFMQAMRAAEPRLTLEDAAWCFAFMMGAVATATSGNGWMRTLSSGLFCDTDLDRIETLLLTYLPPAINAVADNFAVATPPSPTIAKIGSTRIYDTILDRAEHLFAERGFHGVSMRKVAEAAGVSVGICDYHFKSKDGLFLAICLRRQPKVNEERHDLLATARAMPQGADRLAAAIGAAMWPPVRRLLKGGRGWRDHYRAMANSITAQTDYWEKTLQVVFLDTGRQMAEAIHEAVADLPLDRAYAAYLVINGLGAVGYSGEQRLSRLSAGQTSGRAYLGMYERFVRFNVGGVLALTGRETGMPETR